MVVEHIFVTTMEPAQTMQAAMQFLASRGFARPDAVAFPIGNGEWTTLEMRRGKQKASRARDVSQLPQVAHVQWDRGRVTVVLTIEPSHVWGGSSGSFGLQVGGADGHPKKMKLHTQMLTAIATGLEQVIAGGVLPGAAAQAWAAADEEAYRLARRRSRRNWIILGVVVALLAGVIALAVLAS